MLRKSQQENETLHQLKAMSFDFQFAKAGEYYYRRHQATTLGKAWRPTTAPRWEIKIERQRPQGDKTGDAKKWDYLVSERELDHIEKHIYRAKRARGLRDRKYRLLPQRVPSDTAIPKILSPGKEEKTAAVQKTHKTKTKKHRAAWAKEQIRGHQDRMNRGRELTEQRSERLCREGLCSRSSPPQACNTQGGREGIRTGHSLPDCPASPGSTHKSDHPHGKVQKGGKRKKATLTRALEYATVFETPTKKKRSLSYFMDDSISFTGRHPLTTVSAVKSHNPRIAFLSLFASNLGSGELNQVFVSPLCMIIPKLSDLKRPLFCCISQFHNRNSDRAQLGSFSSLSCTARAAWG